MWMFKHVDTVLWIYLCDILVYEDVVLKNHMRIVWKEVLIV